MKNKDLAETYNHYLPEDLKTLRISSWAEISSMNNEKLDKAFIFFSSLMDDIECNKDGELTPKGIVVDDILGKLNLEIIKKRDNR